MKQQEKERMSHTYDAPLSYETISAMPKLKNDPYRKIEKALELFVSKRPLRKPRKDTTVLSDSSEYSKHI